MQQVCRTRRLAGNSLKDKADNLLVIELGEKCAEDSIQTIYNKFMDYQISVKKICKTTVDNYGYSIKTIFPNKNEMLCEKVIREALSNYITLTKHCDVTINTTLKKVSCFLSWASDDDNGYIPAKKYTKKLMRPTSEKVKQPYSEQEYKTLVDYFTDKGNIDLVLLLRFMWNTGARCGESLKIKLIELDLEKSRIFVANKIYKSEQEMLLLTNEAKEIVKQLVAIAEKRGDGMLFKWKNRSEPNSIVHNVEIKLGFKIAGRGLHGLRRSFSDRLFKNNLTIPDIKDIMRHRDIGTTERHYRSFKHLELVDTMNEKL